MTKSLAGLALAFTMLAPASVLAASAASATTSAIHSVSVTNDWGQQNPSVGSLDTLHVVASGQVAGQGRSAQTLESCFDDVYAELDRGTIKIPAGYTLQYSTNHGSTYSSKLPKLTWKINCIRAVGSINSGGIVGGHQAYTASGSMVPPSSVGQITLTGGGDGFNAFFDPNYTKVFNIYHHSAPPSIDCHLLSDGSQCSGFPISLTGGTNHKPYGTFSDETHMWIPSGDSSVGFGFDCINATAGSHCSDVANNGRVTVGTGYGNGINNFVTGAIASGKVFAYDRVNRKILCVDPSTKASCSGMPSGGWSTGLSSGYYSDLNNQDMLALGNQIYVTDGSSKGTFSYIGGKVYCFDASTLATCSTGSWPRTAAGPRLAPTVPAMGYSQAGICTLGVSIACIGADGSSLGSNTNMNTELSTVMGAAPSDNVGGDSGVMSTVTAQGDRYYWSRGNWYSVNSISTLPIVDCYDFSTNAQCANFPLTNSTFLSVAPTSQGSTYSVEADPHVPNCIWTNDNFSNILSWDTTTGTNQCKPVAPAGGGAEPAKFQNSVDKMVGKMSCDGQASNNGWSSIAIQSPLQKGQVGYLYVTSTSGQPVSGWQGVPATVANGVASYDLSGLSVSDTGGNPTFRFESTQLGPNAKIHVTLSAVGSTPQMCFDLYAMTNVCPSVTAMDNGAPVGGNLDPNVTASFDEGMGGTYTDSAYYSITLPTRYECGTSPGAPSIGAVKAGLGTADFSIANPASFGGFKQQGYEYFVSLDDGYGGTWWRNAGATHLDNLDPGFHCVKVETVTDYAWSSFSNEQCFMVGGLPSQPYFTNVDSANSRLRFYWDPPFSSGANKVTYLLKVYNQAGVLQSTCQTSKLYCDVDQLKNAASYSATVQAVNKYGKSDLDSTNGTPSGPIGQPTNVLWTATGDQSQLKLSWTAPTYYSGESLDYYRVCVFSDNAYSFDMCWYTSDTHFTADGLQPKYRYGFVVYAVSTTGRQKGSPIFYHRGQ